MNNDKLIKFRDSNHQKKTYKSKNDNSIKISESNPFNYDILIIDHDKPTLQILDLFFELKGFSSFCIRSGNKVLEKLSEFIPKLILIDVMLPDVTAFELCKKIKFNQSFKNIPIFYLTSIPENRVLENLEFTKANGLITKPFTLEALDSLIKYIE